MALTSFLTGITEPIEFSFMFLAFPLYVVHAVLTGISMTVMNVLGVKLGFTFSAGLFDYLLSYGLGTNAWILLPVGLVYGGVYYAVFYFVITKWNLKTPGREEEPADAPERQTAAPADAAETAPARQDTRGQKYLAALGGKDNIKTIDACATRLRVEVAHDDQVNADALKKLGARGVVKGAAGSVQVVIGPEADLISDEIKPYLK